MADTELMAAEKVLIVVATVLLLGGCMSVTPEHTQAAERMCANFGGVDRIPAQPGPTDRLIVRCRDSTQVIGPVAARETTKDSP